MCRRGPRIDGGWHLANQDWAVSPRIPGEIRDSSVNTTAWASLTRSLSPDPHPTRPVATPPRATGGRGRPPDRSATASPLGGAAPPPFLPAERRRDHLPSAAVRGGRIPVGGLVAAAGGPSSAESRGSRRSRGPLPSRSPGSSPGRFVSPVSSPAGWAGDSSPRRTARGRDPCRNARDPGRIVAESGARDRLRAGHFATQSRRASPRLSPGFTGRCADRPPPVA